MQASRGASLATAGTAANASREDASKQLQANEHEWAPPGAFAAALSTFKATLQDVTHSTNSLKEVCSSVFSCPNGCST